jgi:hypothetical protein
MKHAVVAVFLALISFSNAHDAHWNRRHTNIAHKRQAPPAGNVSQPSAIPSSASSAPSAVSSTLSTLSTLPSISSSSTPANSVSPVASPTYSISGAPGAIPLSQLTSGMPTGPTFAVSSTYPAGAQPTYAGAPGLPPPCKFTQYLVAHEMAFLKLHSCLQRG